jgi:uncharacterized protein YndB with AHSA1/START domain
MTNTATEALCVVAEREMPHPPEKIWRALTQPQLIEEWLMKNDFKPVVTTVSIFAQTGALSTVRLPCLARRSLADRNAPRYYDGPVK